MVVAERIEAVEGVLLDPAAATDGELIDALVVVERVETELALRVAAVTAEADRRLLARAEGCVSTAAWLAQRCDLPRSAAGARVRQARNLEHMPATVAAAEAGELSVAKVALLARARRAPVAEEFDRVETDLVAEVKRLTCDGTARLLRQWALWARDLRPDGSDDASAEPPVEDRPSELYLSKTFGGRWVLNGDLTAEDGAILAQGVQAATDVLFHAGVTAADGALLTPAQRRGHGFIEVFRRGMAADDDRPGAHPLVLAMIDLEKLVAPRSRSGATVHPLRRPGAGVGVPPLADRGGSAVAAMTGRAMEHGRERGDLPPPTSGSDGPQPTLRRRGNGRATTSKPPGWLDELLGTCEIEGAGPVPIEAIQRLACDGVIRRVVIDADGELLDVGRAHRLASAAQRAGLRARDRGCVFPGCDRSPGWCQAHHLTEFADGGATRTDEMSLVCTFHHHLLHEGHWSLHHTPDGWTATSPEGRTVHQPDRPHRDRKVEVGWSDGAGRARAPIA